jgi:small subunit ribosomal protein S16
MATKIRLQRFGKKGKPFYHVVVADARAPRDGKFIERLGSYNPNTNPATIELDLNSAVQWLHNGAQPTDTARAILSYKGALLKHHLDGGIRKGALTQEQADAKLAAWLEAKAGKVDSKKEGLSKAQEAAKAKAFKAEQAANAKRLAAAAQAEVEATEEVAEEAAVEETPAAEEVAAEEAPEVVAEVAPAVEEEAPATEEAPEVVAEETPAVEEAPAEEQASEEAEA